MINKFLLGFLILYVLYQIYLFFISLPKYLPDSLTKLTDNIRPSLIPLGKNIIDDNSIIPLATENEFIEEKPEEYIVSKPAMVLLNKPDNIPEPKPVDIIENSNKLNLN